MSLTALPVSQSVGCLQAKCCPRRKRAREKIFPWKKPQTAVALIIKGTNYSNLTVVLLSVSKEQTWRTAWHQNFVTAKGASFTCHPPLLRFLSHPFLSLSLNLCLFLATLSSPVVNEKENKQLRCSLDWTRCVAWTTEGQAWGVWCWTRLEKSEEVDICVCVLDTPTEPPGWRGVTADGADWHTDTLHISLNPPALSQSSPLSSSSSLALWCWWEVLLWVLNSTNKRMVICL